MPVPKLAHSFSFGDLHNEDEQDEVSEQSSDYSDDDERNVRKDDGNDKSKVKGHWTAEEDSLLQDAVQKYEAKNWKKIAEDLNGRTDV